MIGENEKLIGKRDYLEQQVPVISYSSRIFNSISEVRGLYAVAQILVWNSGLIDNYEGNQGS